VLRSKGGYLQTNKMAGFGRSNSLSINTSGSLLYVYIISHPKPCHVIHARVLGLRTRTRRRSRIAAHHAASHRLPSPTPPKNPSGTATSVRRADVTGATSRARAQMLTHNPNHAHGPEP
jgi:hypothetical protein